MQLPRPARHLFAILIAAAGVVGLVFVVPFVLPAFLEPDLRDRGGYLGVLLGAIAIPGASVALIRLVLGFRQREELVKILRRRQELELRARINALRRGVGLDFDLPFRSTDGRAQSLNDLTQTLLDGRNLGLMGSAGSGKTYSVLQLAYRLLRVQPDSLPVVIGVGDWLTVDDAEHSVTAFMQRQFSISARTARKLVNDGTVVPLFDGLDELAVTTPGGDRPKFPPSPDAAPQSSREIALISGLIDWQANNVAAARYVVSSRTSETLAYLRADPSAAVCTIVAFTDDEGSRLVSRVLGRDEDSTFGSRVLRSISKGRPSRTYTHWQLAMVIRISRPHVRNCSLDETGSARIQELVARMGLVGAFVYVSSTPGNGLLRDVRGRMTRFWLRQYASFLQVNETSKREVYGRRMHAHQLRLHRLWPIAGRRMPRFIDFLLCVTLSAPGLSWLIWFCWPRGVVLRTLALLFVLIYIGFLIRTSTKAWVPPATFDRGRLARPQALALQLISALLIGGAAGIFFSWAVGLLCFISAWCAIGLTVGFGQTLTTDSEAKIIGPYGILRQEHRISELSAAVVFPVIAVGFTYSFGFVRGLVFATLYCFLVGETVASALWRRYLSMILAKPVFLPPFPYQFLEYARRLGLVRTSSVSYEFRHDQIRLYLAAEPGELPTDS